MRNQYSNWVIASWALLFAAFALTIFGTLNGEFTGYQLGFLFIALLIGTFAVIKMHRSEMQNLREVSS